MIGFASTMMELQDQEMWKWKTEPESPKGTYIENVEDDWFMHNDKSLESTTYAADESVMYDDQPTNRAHRVTKILNELNEWIKEEPFSYWLEERTNLPIFDELETPECGQNKSVYPAVIKNQQEQYNTKTLLEEFETVLEDVEACYQTIPSSVSTLTPPQSPPPNKLLTVDSQLLVTLQPVQTIQSVISSQQQELPVYNIIVSPEKQQQQQPAVYQNEVCVPEQWNPESVSLDPLGGENVANDLAVVDEYVRSHTEDIPTEYSSCTSPSGSCISSEDSTSDDPDWIADTSCNKKQSISIGKKNRCKPYSHPTVEDKKVRKKEQNKNAATRYRQKKKQEIKDILGEEHELTECNEKLQGQVKDLQREIGYLKGLMRDLFKAKGLIK
ncbi:PREDICTED: activating transcription factor of chaperone [Polistes dominula]|uniref:Activating transcription factor of chaperone n=1 Tax=Polistes dominula TaxID=743375 RepID=A0ABM1IRD2_POLDO|nr:PREDICTED: activating transcription factor of chaperone [Polistes dominula]